MELQLFISENNNYSNLFKKEGEGGTEKTTYSVGFNAGVGNDAMPEH